MTPKQAARPYGERILEARGKARECDAQAREAQRQGEWSAAEWHIAAAASYRNHAEALKVLEERESRNA
jgi:hypothetical protein